jgi:nucleoside 2-deoxyribosyltransferase
MGQLDVAKQNRLKVFLIHSERDADFARDLRRLLMNRVNARVFSQEDLNAGEKWQTKLRNELTSSDVVVALLTPSAPESDWVLHEIGAAWGLRKPIIPVVSRRDMLNRIPISLDIARAIELSDVKTPENADKFVDAFEESLAAVQTS